jgi:predicted heme/steroid binding protein
VFKYLFFYDSNKHFTLKIFTKSQLALRNGQDKDEIWVAFRGKIYDVTASRLWRNGKHYEHWAGQDLTDELADAPHSETVFQKFEVVGVLS